MISVVEFGHLKGLQPKGISELLIVVSIYQQQYFLSGLTSHTEKLFSTPVVALNQVIVLLLCAALLVHFTSYMSQGSLEYLLMLLEYVTKALFPDLMHFPKTLHQQKIFEL